MRNRFLFVCTSTLDFSITEYDSYNYFLFWFSKLYINIYYHKAGPPFLATEIGHSVEAVGVFYPFLSCYLVKQSGPELLPTQVLVCNWPSCQNPMTPCQHFLSSVILRTGAIEMVPMKCISIIKPAEVMGNWNHSTIPRRPSDFVHITSKRG